MVLIRWEPLQDIEALQQDMNRLFENFTVHDSQTFTPAMEICKTPEAIELRFELPGVEASQLDIQVTANEVSVAGERRAEPKGEKDRYLRSEFRYGKFQRVIPLPTRIQNQRVKATYENGILTLHLPLAEEEKNRVVKVSLT